MADIKKPASRKSSLHASPQLGEWLKQIGGSLVFTTYQSGRLFFLSADSNGKMVAMDRNIGAAMGLAAKNDYLWVANQQHAWRFSDIGAKTLGDVEHDAVYMPRKGYFIGSCQAHDILADVEFRGQKHELLFVNTRFSCIAAIDNHYNFRPVWKPNFISTLAAEDRCHLNGIGMRDGKLAYATLCGRYDTVYGWRESKSDGGCVIDIETDEVVCEGLSMPHSPRWHNGKLWLLNSGEGDFGYVDFSTKKFIPVGMCSGFARGLCFIGDYAVIGVSKLRENSFASGMSIVERLKSKNVEQTCGLLIIDSRNGKLIHWLTIEGDLTELYDVTFLPNIQRPFTPGFNDPQLHETFFQIPETEFSVSLPNFKWG